MSRLSEITITHERRPCFISNGYDPSQNKKGWFHRWVDTRTFSGIETFALVELESGDCAYVRPLQMRFLDTKRVEDEYYISHNEEPKTCANCGWYVDEWGCNIDSVIAKTNPGGDCPNWCPRGTYPEKECEIRGE